MHADGATGDRAGRALLRQLGIGLATYRLYPGDTTQPAFVAAVERIQDAARAAVASGPVEAEVRTGEVRLADTVLDDDRAQRLAEACFQRRVEHLRVVAAPTVDELTALFAALTADPAEVEAAGGIAALLAERGASSVVVSAGVPDPSGGREDPDTEPVEAAPSVPTEEVDPDAALPRLLPVPGETGDQLYRRLRRIHDVLGDDTAGRSSFFRRAVRLAAALGDGQQAVFDARVLDRAASERFAERYLGHLTDPELAALVRRVGELHGTEPVALATEVAGAHGRRDTVVALARAADGAGQGPGAHASTGDADVAAQHRLRDGFPAGHEDDRALALVALRDYLRNDARPEQLEQLQDAVTALLRVEVRAQRGDRVRELFDLLEDERRAQPHGPAGRLQAAARAALTVDVVAGLAEDALREGPDTAAAVLRPFGPAAVDSAVEALAVEERRAVRSLLVGTLAALARDGLGPLERHMGHDRWYVARNIATVLGRVRTPATAPLLERLAAHPHQAVRREALHALAGLPAETAAPALARVAAVLGERAEQDQCLEALAALAAPHADAQLAELASGGGEPRPSRRLRRGARRQLARRKEAR